MATFLSVLLVVVFSCCKIIPNLICAGVPVPKHKVAGSENITANGNGTKDFGIATKAAFKWQAKALNMFTVRLTVIMTIQNKTQTILQGSKLILICPKKNKSDSVVFYNGTMKFDPKSYRIDYKDNWTAILFPLFPVDSGFYSCRIGGDFAGGLILEITSLTEAIYDGSLIFAALITGFSIAKLIYYVIAAVKHKKKSNLIKETDMADQSEAPQNMEQDKESKMSKREQKITVMRRKMRIHRLRKKIKEARKNKLPNPRIEETDEELTDDADDIKSYKEMQEKFLEAKRLATIRHKPKLTVDNTTKDDRTSNEETEQTSAQIVTPMQPKFALAKTKANKKLSRKNKVK